MLKFPANIHGFRRSVTGDNFLTLSVDSSFGKDLMEIMEKDSNTMFQVYMEEIPSEGDAHHESKTLKEKFMIRLHVILGEIAEKKGTTLEQEKDLIRARLIEEKIIEKSTTELGVKELSKLCAGLEKTYGI